MSVSTTPLQREKERKRENVDNQEVPEDRQAQQEMPLCGSSLFF
jgi:hypothetical protein